MAAINVKKIAPVGLAFCGWAVLLAGVSNLQDTQSGKNATPAYISNMWWLMSFQGFVTAYTAYVIMKAPSKTYGALGLAAILTAIVFLSCHEFYSAEMITNPAFDSTMDPSLMNYPTVSLHDIIYQMPGNKFVGPMTNYGKQGRSLICFFAGLVICAAADAGIVLTIADEDTTTAVNTPVGDVSAGDV